MAKKNLKKTSTGIPWRIVKRAVIGIAGLMLAVAFWQMAQYFLYHSPFFKVKKIVLSSTLSVIDKKDLLALQGQSLVGLDVRAFYDELSRKYPQVSDLKIHKQFPDRIRVTGFARRPFAQFDYKSKLLTLDAEGVVIDASASRQLDLAVIRGLRDVFRSIGAGEKLEHNSLDSALEILSVFAQNTSLKGRKITGIDVGNLSKIIIEFERGPDVIVDWTEIPQKSEMLSMVLSQLRTNFEKIRYIDLRFKEPVVGREE